MIANKETDVLLKRSGVEVYRKNPFRVLRLPANTSVAQIQRRVQELQMQRQLGIQQTFEDLLIPQGIIDEVDLQRLVHRLSDPVERLADELLWFWSAPDNDDALTALWRGEIGNAIVLWQSREDAIACHNLALIYHLLALELELRGKQQIERKQWETYWHQAWKYWQKAIDDDSVWDYLGERSNELNDPRVGRETVKAFRKAMPLFLALINAQLALKASEEENKGMCLFHLNLLKRFSDRGTYEMALTHATEPLLKEIRTLLETARQREQPPAEVAEWLIESVNQPLRVLSEVFPTHPEGYGLRDELALQIRGWANASVVGGDVKSLHKVVWLLDHAVELAGTERVKEQLIRETNEAKRALELTPILERLATMLKEARDKSERGGYRLMNDAERLLNEVEPLLRQLDRLLSDSPGYQELRTGCHDAVATTVHALVVSAIKAGNRDYQKAKALLERVVKLAKSGTIILFLHSEVRTLDTLMVRQREAWSERAAGWGCLLLLGLIIGLGSTVSDWWKNRLSEGPKKQVITYSSQSTPLQSPSEPFKALLPSKPAASKNRTSSRKNTYPETKEQWFKYLGLEQLVQKYVQGRIKPEGDLDLLLSDLTYKDSTIYLDKETSGDLDGDGEKEKVVIVRINAGGSGTFVYLVILRQGKFVATKHLGDRVVINSLSIRDHEIVFNMLTHGPNDPMATPTKKVTVKCKLIGNRLISKEDIRQERLERIKRRVNQLRTELEGGTKRLKQLSDRISSMDTQITALRQEIELLRSQIRAIEQAYPFGFPSESELESYRALVRHHNELVNQHNNLARHRNALAKKGRVLAESLRQKAVEHDQLVVEYNSLLQGE